MIIFCLFNAIWLNGWTYVLHVISIAANLPISVLFIILTLFPQFEDFLQLFLLIKFLKFEVRIVLAILIYANISPTSIVHLVNHPEIKSYRILFLLFYCFFVILLWIFIIDGAVGIINFINARLLVFVRMALLVKFLIFHNWNYALIK